MTTTVYGQKKLNRTDVRKATTRFILSFLLLTGLGFLSVFLFFKSSQMQKQEIQSQLNDYQDMLRRNELLKSKMDSVYYKLSLLSNDKVNNDIFLRNSVMEDLATCREIIGKDSTGDLSHYNRLIKNIQPILAFKNQLIQLKAEEKTAQRSLQQCLGNISSIEIPQAAPAAPERPRRQPGRLFR